MTKEDVFKSIFRFIFILFGLLHIYSATKPIVPLNIPFPLVID